MKKKRNYFEELSKALDRLNTDWQKSVYLWQISDKIVWCWKWRKITNEEKDILCDRVTKLYKDM